MQQHLHDILNHSDFGQIYTPKIFDQRLKEELLRSHRLHLPFIYIQIPTFDIDFFGLERANDEMIRAWKIAVLTIFNNLNSCDIRGYLPENNGMGLILLGVNYEEILKLRRQILRNLHNAELLDHIRSKPSQPLFRAFYNTAVVEHQHQNLVIQMENFSNENSGFFSLEPFHYSELKHNQWNKFIINWLKRSFDFSIALMAIILISPILITLIFIIKISDLNAPVFFGQSRVGMNGDLFKMWKFRSMYMDAEARKQKLIDAGMNESTGPTFKMEIDPRVTPIGRFLRKYSIDELPQLWNVLIGDMCLVGPRPPVPKEVKEYLPWHKMRLAVKPGLTCIWQVSGRSNIGFEEWMRLDNQYVRHGNLIQDIDLIRRTFRVVLKGDGAY